MFLFSDAGAVGKGHYRTGTTRSSHLLHSHIEMQTVTLTLLLMLTNVTYIGQCLANGILANIGDTPDGIPANQE